MMTDPIGMVCRFWFRCFFVCAIALCLWLLAGCASTDPCDVNSRIQREEK